MSQFWLYSMVLKDFRDYSLLFIWFCRRVRTWRGRKRAMSSSTKGEAKGAHVWTNMFCCFHLPLNQLAL